MPIKANDPATDWRTVNEWEGGASWIAHPDEKLQRASHALATDEGVWLVDPVDVEGLDEWVAEMGDVAGVVVLLDRHTRDAGPIARRHGVPVSVPDWMDGIEEKVDAPVERFHRDLGATAYGAYELIDNSLWQEAVLYGEDSGTLVVPEAVGTNDFFRVGTERLGVSPVLRLTPPKKLRRFDPERVLVGHGEGVTTDAAAALDDALEGARRRAPRAFAETLRAFVG